MTISQIAADLGVSKSTVSKALNGATDIAEETKKMILNYVAEKGYKAKTQHTPVKRICVFYYQASDQHRNDALQQIVASFSAVAISRGFEIVSDVISLKPVDFNLNHFLTQNNFCAAFLVGTSISSPINEQLKNTTVPIALLDNRIQGNPLISSVTSDNIGAVRTAVEYLIKMGHQNIGFLSGEKRSFVSAERFAGYVYGLICAGLTFNDNYIYYGDFTTESGKAAADFFFDKDVTAIISCSDVMAMALIDRLRALGKSVPEEVSVIGFDDLELLKYTNYNLTTVKQDFETIGKNALLLIQDMLGGRHSQNLVSECQLIERGTVAKI